MDNKKVAAVAKYSVYGSKVYTDENDGANWFKAGTALKTTGYKDPKAGGSGSSGTCKGDGTTPSAACTDIQGADTDNNSSAFYWVQGLSGAFEGPYTSAYRAWYLASPADAACVAAAVDKADSTNGTKLNTSIGLKWTDPTGKKNLCKLAG